MPSEPEASSQAQASATTRPPRAEIPESEPSDGPKLIGSILKDRSFEKYLPAEPTPEEAERQRLAVLRASADDALQEKARRRWQWENLLREIGRRYESATLDTFEAPESKQLKAKMDVMEYLVRLPENVQAGRGVIFYGPPGTGKDHLMAAMMREAIEEEGLQVRWINGLDFYGSVRDRMDDERPEAELVRDLGTPDILAISDPLPPWGELSGFQAQMLFRIIDRRYRNQRPVWCTMNVAHGEEAASRLGTAVVDRLRERALAIHCDWPSYRARKA